MTSPPSDGLTLAQSMRDELTAHCLRELPLEGCGLLVGDRASSTVVRVIPTGNAAQSSRLYSVDSRDFLRADRQAEADGLEIIGVFHSHTHTDPYPSPTDVSQAPDPGWHYVIVSLRHQVPSVRSYRINLGEVTEEPVLEAS